MPWFHDSSRRGGRQGFESCGGYSVSSGFSSPGLDTCRPDNISGSIPTSEGTGRLKPAPLLATLCAEGTREQAKHAARALVRQQ